MHLKGQGPVPMKTILNPAVTHFPGDTASVIRALTCNLIKQACQHCPTTPRVKPAQSPTSMWVSQMQRISIDFIMGECDISSEEDSKEIPATHSTGLASKNSDQTTECGVWSMTPIANTQNARCPEHLKGPFYSLPRHQTLQKRLGGRAPEPFP